MSSTLDDEDLALSINPSHTRRNSARGTNDDAPQPQVPRSVVGAPPANPPQSKGDSRLSQYRKIKTLGEGSFGKVTLAEHITTKQQVALKVINRRKLMARDMQGRTEREIQYLQLLRHPHIIKLYTVIKTSTDIVMVLEYAGSELFNYIVDHGKMNEAKARKFFQQIVCAVEYCHRHKIVHRDLKPENLLLDEDLNVKIADFGLSNIMTDGNFLKTSCGSPNYAAPEVISGKLYAGPEVDVWSCGVILYVLLVGRLPFDDEYIPALFKKIAQGQYHMPSWLSPGAQRLIKKILQTDPVKRISIQEIRQDSWFNKDLAPYLQLQLPEFYDTGVDPNKAIDPKKMAPSRSNAVAEKMHNDVIGKLGKAMGYGRADVQEALAVDEPNAIKDAYLIVRERQLMEETPEFANNPATQAFLAQSPPAFTVSSPMGGTALAQTHSSSPTPSSSVRPERPRQGSSTGSEVRSYQSRIGVLASSMPEYHEAWMHGQPKQSEWDEATEQSKDEQATTAARLKPHNRSIEKLERMNRPEAMTPLQAHQAQKTTRPTKWQFGIRSRNSPSEAMLALLKAVKALGAEWEVGEVRDPGQQGDEDAPTGPGPDESGISSSEEDTDREEEMRRRRRSSAASGGRRSSVHSGASRGRRRSRIRYGSWNDWGYPVPADPWVIEARFRKDGMYPPGVLHAGSTNSSRIDLSAEQISIASAAGSDVALNRRRSSTMSSTTSTPGTNPPSTSDNPAFAGPGISALSLGSGYANTIASGQLSERNPVADDSAFVYVTIQLYSIEKEFYLVDFKCAGYERLIRRLVRHVEPVDRRDEDEDEDDDEAIWNEDKHSDSGDDSDNFPMEMQGGKPREGGHWATLRKMSSTSNRRPQKLMRHNRNRDDEGDDDGESETGTKSGIKLVEEIVADGRADEEKDVASPFPFLDVASRLIIQLAEAD